MTLKEKLTVALQQNLPFTAYQKPDNKLVTIITQQDSSINYLQDFNNKGFVFAPFNDDEKTVIFPFNLSKSFIFKNYATNKNLNELLFLNNKKDKQTHIKLVKKGIQYIKNGQTNKIVLARKETISLIKFNAINTFISLLNSYKTAFVYIWFHPKIGLWLGATPEILIKTKNNHFKTMSLAGTQHYKDTLNVKWNKKEITEQNIVTSFIIKQLNNLNIANSKSEPYTVKAGNLLHLKTDISGRFANKNQLEQLIKALHPTPAVCGLPKNNAKEFILKNENFNREFYTGFLGELNIEKIRENNRKNIENHAYNLTETATNLYVNLRCMKANKDTISLYLGGGITGDSNPENEYIETVLKSKIIKKCL